MNKIGLIAGEGMLPVIWAENAKRAGVELITIGVTPAAEHTLLKKNSHHYHQISVGQLTQIIDTLQAEQISQAVMMGKVQKVQLYQGLKLDQRLLAILQSLPEKNDDAILLALVGELAQEGIQFIKQTTFMEREMAREGLLTPGLEVSTDLQQDMELGFQMAKEIGRLDIGQTVVVKNGAVIAVEAIEGTDAAILRGGELAREGAVVAKVSKPQQDLRFDIPTIGLETMKNMAKMKARGLVLEADKTFFIQQKEVLELATREGIAILAMR